MTINVRRRQTLSSSCNKCTKFGGIHKVKWRKQFSVVWYGRHLYCTMHVVGCVCNVRYGTAYGLTSTAVAVMVVCAIFIRRLRVAFFAIHIGKCKRNCRLTTGSNVIVAGVRTSTNRVVHMVCARLSLNSFVSLSFCRRFKTNHVFPLYSLFTLVVFTRSLCYASCTSSQFTILDSCHGWKVVISICIFLRCVCECLFQMNK